MVDALATTAGGAGLVWLCDLSSEFAERPMDTPLIVVRREARPFVRERAPHAEVMVLPRALAPTPLRLAWEHSILPAHVRSFGAEVVLSPFNVAPTQWLPSRAKLVVMVSNLAPFSDTVVRATRGPERWRNIALRALTLKTLARADLVLLQSRQALTLINQPGLEDKAVVLPPSPARVPLTGRARDALRPPKPYLFVASDLYRFKGIELVIEALAMIRHARRPLLVICGRRIHEDYATRLESQIIRLGLADSVQLLGPQPREYVLGLMREATACIAPSRFENMSKVPLEAMAVGTPVLASRIPSYVDGCEDAACYFELNRPRELSLLIERVLEDDRLRTSLIARGKVRMSRLGDGSGASNVLEAIESLI
ncbi:MAG: glycosyltransferase [Actinomycetota bacterium]|nr:glycosyltransferase [Actinomycetota bacterium]